MEEFEEYYEKAKQLVSNVKELDDVHVSASLIQRRLRIGTVMTNRILERLEIDGIVSKYDGKTPRQILV